MTQATYEDLAAAAAELSRQEKSEKSQNGPVEVANVRSVLQI